MKDETIQSDHYQYPVIEDKREVIPFGDCQENWDQGIKIYKVKIKHKKKN